jgi:hypothetical protein
MARIDAFTGLSEFLIVADRASFRAAAAELRVTPAAISQAIRSLEERVGFAPPATHDTDGGVDRGRRRVSCALAARGD